MGTGKELTSVQRVVDGRYELVRPLGRGGMGEVWLGRDHRLDRDVAVKLLRPSSLPALADVDALISRFDREARLTAKLENPGVPAVYDTGTDNDDLYLVMQVIAGADLAEFQAENEPVPVSWVAAIGAQIASVLGAAHAAGLIHRDLKPRNVMITETGEIKVLDFGIALLRDPNMSRLTRTAEAVGTPAYMAPEQALHGQASPSSDLYSLGCVLYELLTGQYVFDAKTALGMMHRHLSDTPRPVLSLRPDTDPALADLIARLLSKRVELRPASAHEVYEALLPLVTADKPSGAVIPMDPTRPFRDTLSAPRPPASVAAASVGVLDMPTMPALPVALPPPPPPLPPDVKPAKMVPLDTGVRRVVEGYLLIWGSWETLDRLVELGSGGPAQLDTWAYLMASAGMITLGLWLRRRRLQLRHFWSLGPFGKRVQGPRPTKWGERTVEWLMIIAGIALWCLFIGQMIVGTINGDTFMYIEAPYRAVVICTGVLVPGLLMRQRRLGRPYPWKLRAPRS